MSKVYLAGRLVTISESALLRAFVDSLEKIEQAMNKPPEKKENDDDAC